MSDNTKAPQINVTIDLKGIDELFKVYPPILVVRVKGELSGNDERNNLKKALTKEFGYKTELMEGFDNWDAEIITCLGDMYGLLADKIKAELNKE